MAGFGPVGSAPVAALADPGIGTVVLMESVLFDAPTTGIAATPLQEGMLMDAPSSALAATALLEAVLLDGSLAGSFAALVMGDSIAFAETTAATLIQIILDNIEMTGSPLGQLEAHAYPTESMQFGEALALAWQLMAAESIDFAGTAAGNLTQLAALVDSLCMTGVVTNRLDALAIVSTVLAINGMMATGWMLDAVESIAFQDALAGSMAAITALVESAGFADTSSPAMRITAVMAESIALADSDTTSLQAFEALSEQVLFYTVIRLGDVEYAGWVLNEGAPSQYKNYPFNGFAAFDGHYYGTADTGLYLLEGPDDAGTPIDAHIRTALMNFGTGKLKRIPDVYIAFAGGNNVVLKAIMTDENGLQAEHWYTSTLPPGTQLRNGRVKLGRGLKSVYWQFELTNLAGSALLLDELAFHTLVLDRRL